jgi:hypothetical protein
VRIRPAALAALKPAFSSRPRLCAHRRFSDDPRRAIARLAIVELTIELLHVFESSQQFLTHRRDTGDLSFAHVLADILLKYVQTPDSRLQFLSERSNLIELNNCLAPQVLTQRFDLFLKL